MNLLTPLQQKVLNAFFSVPDLKKQFYLTGGTALSAFFLKHRLSDDLDFFTHAVSIESVERLIEDVWTGAGLHVTKERSSPSYRRYRINRELQVDVVKDVDFRVGSPELQQNFMVDNLKNIAVNKVLAIYGRLDAKDYVDLYFLKPVLKFNILNLLDLARQKDKGLENFQWAKIIADVDTFTVLPRLVEPLSLDKLKTFFHTLRDELIDAMGSSLDIRH